MTRPVLLLLISCTVRTYAKASAHDKRHSPGLLGAAGADDVLPPTRELIAKPLSWNERKGPLLSAPLPR